MKDYYSLLGVESNATKADIKKNYRLLSKKFHPDKSNDLNSVEKFIAITEAYDVLSNKKSRIKYDLFRWEQLKRKEESADNFTTVIPPVESTRTRRNKSQQKRSIKYHQTTGEAKKLLQLVIESFYIVGRYVLSILGISLFLIILSSAVSHLSGAFEKNIIQGIFIGSFIVVIVYIISWILKNAILEFKRDLEAFSIFYKITQKEIAPTLLSIFAFVLFIYAFLFMTYF